MMMMIAGYNIIIIIIIMIAVYLSSAMINSLMNSPSLRQQERSEGYRNVCVILVRDTHGVVTHTHATGA